MTLLLVGYGNAIVLSPWSEGWTRASANAALAVLVLGWAWKAGASAGDLGLGRRANARGLVLGVGVAVALAAVSVAGAVAGWVLFPDASYAPVSGLSPPELAVDLLLRYPLGTALTEECAFRGALLAMWTRAARLRTAAIASALAFVAWHGVVVALTLREAGIAAGSLQLAAAWAGALVALGVAVALLTYLRVFSGGIIGPTLAHWLPVASARFTAWVLGI